MSTTIAQQIRLARLNARLTQAELAQRLFVGQSYVAKLETERKKNPTLDVLLRIAAATGTSVSRLTRGL